MNGHWSINCRLMEINEWVKVVLKVRIVKVTEDFKLIFSVYFLKVHVYIQKSFVL